MKDRKKVAFSKYPYRGVVIAMATFEGQFRINECSFEALTNLLGIGKKYAQVIMDARMQDGPLTEERFLQLGIRGADRLLDKLDFEVDHEAEDNDDVDRVNGLDVLKQKEAEVEELRRIYGSSERVKIASNHSEVKQEWVVGMSEAIDKLDRPRSKAHHNSENLNYSGVNHSSRASERERTPGFPRRTRRNLDFSDSEEDTGKTSVRFDDTRVRASNKRHSGANIPRLLLYDGKSRWSAFYIKFKTYAEMEGWSQQEKLRNLCFCLKDSASEFYALCLERDEDISFPALIKRLRRGLITKSCQKQRR